MSELIGKTIGQYQIVELLSDSRETFLYKGFQPSMNRFVAVQVLKVQSPADIRAFEQQNELLAQVQHPNILPIIDSGQAEGFSYRVLRYVEAGTLRNHLFEYAELRKALSLINGIVDGLEQIHAQGFVHGNLEASNIYLDEVGRPLLTDFGLPKAPGAPISAYMSPEQTQGGAVDRRTDIYALGVLLYEILTGEMPPAGLVVSLRAKRPDLPEAVEKVIFKAMAQNPDARFQRATEFRNALSASLMPVVPAQSSVPQPSISQPGQPPLPPAPKQTNWVAIIFGIIIIVLMCGGIGLLIGWWNNQGGGTPIEPTSPPVEILPTEAPPEPTTEPEPENPIEPPGGGVELPEVCSSGGFVLGSGLFGSVILVRKRIFTRRRAGNRGSVK